MPGGGINAIHHVTAITGTPQVTLDFYTGVLGLRLVKRPVNYDDPGVYHFYFGNEAGAPGTILTFFPWLGMPNAIAGTGSTAATAFEVPGGSIGFWRDRLHGRGYAITEIANRFDSAGLAFTSPDGLALELIEGTAATGIATSRARAGIEPRHAVRGFHSVTLSVAGYERTAKLLVDGFGMVAGGAAENRFRFQGAEGGLASIVDVLCQPDGRRARMGLGSVHHVAFRTPNAAAQVAIREKLAALHHDVTPVLDRTYFQSIYFREPGGTIFEIATDPPGFSADEPLESLGRTLALPRWLEPRRATIEQLLSPMRWPED